MYEEQVLLQVTEPVVLNGRTTISVPMNFKGLLVVDQKVLRRVEPCLNQNVKDLMDRSEYRDYNGKMVNVILVASATDSMLAGWGFGNINVNNERLKEAYRVGANGKFSVKITNAIKLMSAFPGYSTVTMDQVRGTVSTLFNSIGSSLLGGYFANTNVSVFEISSCIEDFRKKFYDAMKDEEIFGRLGIELSVLSVNGIHVPEEDIELIRDRINENN